MASNASVDPPAGGCEHDFVEIERQYRAPGSVPRAGEANSDAGANGERERYITFKYRCRKCGHTMARRISPQESGPSLTLPPGYQSAE